MDETVKATGEIAKMTGKAVDLLKEVNAFLFKILGPPAEEIGFMLQDHAKYFRYKNLIRLRDKVEAIHYQRKIEGKTIAIPPRYALPLIESASTENNESLQDMWAGLIANSMDPEKQLNPKRIYIQILSSLEPLDAKVLQFFTFQGWKLFREVPGGGVTVTKLVQEIGLNDEEISLSLQNLARLGCMIDEHVPEFDTYGSSSFGKRVTEPGVTFRPSPLGFDLIKACQVVELDD